MLQLREMLEKCDTQKKAREMLYLVKMLEKCYTQQNVRKMLVREILVRKNVEKRYG